MSAELVVVGGGRMGEALVGGLLAGGWEAGALCVVETLADRRQALAARLPPDLRVVATPPAAEGVVLAVKPADVAATAEAVARAGARRVLSIAAGVPLAALEAALEAGSSRLPVVRAMPNTPALVGAGAAAVAAGTWAEDDDLAWAEAVLGAVGTVVRVPEDLLDAVTGLSGSGPAYVFLVAEALIDAGVLVGLPHEVSAGLTVQTLLGAARLLAEREEAPAALRQAVTSPGGTTAAGLRALEAGGVRAAVVDAVVAATERSRHLGQEASTTP
jgi:pyrroline-5-carboxylate reductase